MNSNKKEMFVLAVVVILIALGGSKIGGMLATASIFGSGVLTGYLLYQATKSVIIAGLSGILFPTFLYATDMSKDIIEFGKMSGGLLQTVAWVALGIYIIYIIISFSSKSGGVG